MEDYQNLELTVAGYPARAIVYRDKQGWHSEVAVNFGKDLGNESYLNVCDLPLLYRGDLYVCLECVNVNEKVSQALMNF